jgi:hypothetical protein
VWSYVLVLTARYFTRLTLLCLWNTAPCSSFEVDKRFLGTCLLYFQCRSLSETSKWQWQVTSDKWQVTSDSDSDKWQTLLGSLLDPENSGELFLGNFNRLTNRLKLNSMVWVRERTIPTERPQLVGEVVANFLRIEGCHVVSVTDPYGRILGFLARSRYFSIK